MKTLLFFLLTSSLLADSLEKGFVDPPITARPKGYWVWTNGNFSLPKLREELREFKDKGMGGVDIWDVAGWVDENKVVPAGPPFMGDESVQAIAEAIRVGGELGLEMGLTISSSWNAGGSWVKPEHGVMGLFRSSVEIKGPAEVSIELPFPELPASDAKDGRITPLIVRGADGLPTFYRDVAVLALPNKATIAENQVLNLTEHFTEGKLRWRAPKGDWRIVRYVCTGTGQPLMRPSPNSNGLMIDHFSAEATRAHLMFFIDKLQNELGDLSKSALDYLYTDSYEANSAAWTPTLPQEFLNRCGYDLTPYLPVLDGKTVGDKEISERFLFDFKRVLSDLIIENHYQLSTEICGRYGLGFRAEAGGPGPPVHNCPFESLRSLGVCSVPRGEFWYEHPAGEKHMHELQIVKGPASAAHLYGQPQTEAEAFTALWMWQRGPGDLKQVADKAMCEGLTRFVYHTSPHIPDEAGKPGWIYNFGTIINTTRAWWPLSRAFHDYLGRCCYLLQQGHFVGDVLYYYGDQAPNFVEPKHIPKELGFGYDYDVCNSDIILNRLDVRDGRLVLPHGQRYRVLVLPDQEAFNPEVLEKIAQLAAKGAVIVGPKPKRSHSLANRRENDRRVRELADKLWSGRVNRVGSGKVYAVTGDLRKILLENGITPDVQINLSDPTVIDFIHRRTDDADIYFIRNTTEREIDADVTLRVFERAPQLWNPETGTIERLHTFIQRQDGVQLPLRLPAFGSNFIVFRDRAPAQVSAVAAGSASFPAGDNIAPRNYEIVDDGFIAWENGDFTLKIESQKPLRIQTNKIKEPKIVNGPWQVRFPFGWGAPTRIEFPELISWTDHEHDGIKYFSGVAEYHNTFNLPNSPRSELPQVMLDLGKVSKAARVWLNGREAGTLWHAPYVIDVSEFVRPGKNHLMIEVANVWNNQLVGDARVPAEFKRTKTNITRGPNPWMTPWQDVPLIESGLMGPVVLRFGQKIKIR